MQVSVLGQHPRVVDQKVEPSVPYNSVNLKSDLFGFWSLVSNIISKMDVAPWCVGLDGWIFGWDEVQSTLQCKLKVYMDLREQNL